MDNTTTNQQQAQTSEDLKTKKLALAWEIFKKMHGVSEQQPQQSSPQENNK